MRTQNIYHFQYKKEITLNYPKSAAMGFFQGTQEEFETAAVNEPSVFEPLKFYCRILSVAYHPSERSPVSSKNCRKRETIHPKIASIYLERGVLHVSWNFAVSILVHVFRL